MTTVKTDRLVDDFLHRLEAAAAALPPERRNELVAEIPTSTTPYRRQAPPMRSLSAMYSSALVPQRTLHAADDVPSSPIRPTERRGLHDRLAVAGAPRLAAGPSRRARRDWPAPLDPDRPLSWCRSLPAWSARDKRVGLLLLPLIPPTLLLILSVSPIHGGHSERPGGCSHRSPWVVVVVGRARSGVAAGSSASKNFRKNKRSL